MSATVTPDTPFLVSAALSKAPHEQHRPSRNGTAVLGGQLMTGTARVTIMFTDIVGSTALLERLGDQAGTELLRRHFGILRRAITTHGGREVKTLGDGLM